MLVLAVRRLASMILIMLVISVMLFVFFEGDKLNLAMRVLGPYSTMEGRVQWLADNGYDRPLIERYLSWLGGFLTGDWNESAQFSAPVLKFLAPRLANTAILAGCVFVITVAISLVLGVLSGISEASLRDRAITIFSVLTTSMPEFASATFFVAIFVFWLNVLPGTSPFTNGFPWVEIVLPVLVTRHLQFRLLHPHDARLDGRSDDIAICAHRHPERLAL